MLTADSKRQICNLTSNFYNNLNRCKPQKMYSLRRLIQQSFIRNHVRDSLAYSTKPKHVVRRKTHKYKSDPGINQRKRLLGNATVDEIEDVELDDLESDFMNVHISHKDFQREMEARKEQEKYFIVRQKYFKEKLPNFLTMNDKLQIKHLHRTNPEQWTVEKLAESFPALPHIISVSSIIEAFTYTVYILFAISTFWQLTNLNFDS